MRRYVLNRYTISIAIGLIIYSVILAAFVHNNPAFYGGSIDAENADHFGSLIGGVIGSLFSFLSLIVLIINIKDSNDNTIKNDQENRFFSLLNIYNDYCKDLYIESLEKNKEIRSKKTFVIITREFERIYLVVNKIFADFTYSDKIDITFNSLYYGVGPKSSPQLKMKLNSIRSNQQTIIDDFMKEIESIYGNSNLWRFKYYKPFGGHQSRLYQYLNFLEQIFKVVDNSLIKSESMKNEYVEIFKSQLSLYEYFIILIAANTVKPSLKKYIIKYEFILEENELFFDSFNISLNEYLGNTFSKK